jgi:Lon-like protease
MSGLRHGQTAQGIDGDRVAALSRCPCGHLDHSWVGVGQGGGAVELRSSGDELAGTSPHLGCRIGQGRGDLFVAQRAQPVEGAEGRGPHRRCLIGQGTSGRFLALRMASQGSPAPPFGDPAVGRLRGRLHVTTMTAHDDGLPSPPPVPEAPPPPPTVDPNATEWSRASAEVAPGAPPSGPFPLITPSWAAGPGPVPEGGRTVRRRRRHWWLWVVFVVLVVGIAVASRVNLNYYAIQPGVAQSVQQFITVPTDRSHPVHQPVLLTDVEIGRVTALSYLFFKVQSDTDLESVSSVVGPFPPSQLIAEGNLEMSQAEAAAKTAALVRLGYHVTATAAGAVIFGTFDGTPAASTLQVGDVITAVDGTPVTSAKDLTVVLDRYHSGQTITMSVRVGGSGPPRPVAVTLHATRVDLGFGQYTTLNLGIEPEDEVDYQYPFPVNINVTNIGGPSAGLAMTLGVMDALTDGSITGGHTVAATGTIDADGDVGAVGGVPQKTVAVENAGATIFIVPRGDGNYQQALSKDRPGLKVYAVTTLDQALAVLAAHGGHVPAAPASSSPGG